MENTPIITTEANSKEPMTETRDFDFGRVKIVFVDSTGKPWTSACGEPIASHRWKLYIDGHLYPWIKSVKLPELTYGKTGILTVTVEFYCVEGEKNPI